MSACLKSFSYYGIYTCLLAFLCKYAAGNHVHYGHAVLFQVWSPFLWTSGRGKDNLHALLYKNTHELIYLRIHQRNVYAKRQVFAGVVARSSRFKGLLALQDVVSQSVGMHASCTQKAKASVKAHCRCKSPSAAPNHSTGNDWMLYSKQLTNSIHFLSFFSNNKNQFLQQGAIPIFPTKFLRTSLLC